MEQRDRAWVIQQRGILATREDQKRRELYLFIKQAHQANMRAQGVLAVCLHRGKFTATLGVEAAHVAGNENEKSKEISFPYP